MSYKGALLDAIMLLYYVLNHQRAMQHVKKYLVAFKYFVMMTTIAHLLGSERSMLVPNLIIFPTCFCSALRRRKTLSITTNRKTHFL